MLSAAQVQLAEQLSSHPHDYTHRRKHTQSSIESTTAVNRMMGDGVNLRKIIQQPCLQCFDAVGWAAGRASGL